MSEWISPEERLPKIGERVLIAREYNPGEPPIVEQAILTPGGWWKVWGTNCKRIIAWRAMPDPPEVEK